MAGKDAKLAVSKTTKQGRERTQVCQKSSSGAPEPAAIGSAAQFDNDDDKKLWRIRKALWADMLGGALHPFASSSPKLADHQRILEEQTARSARSRRKAIDDFHWFCGS